MVNCILRSGNVDVTCPSAVLVFCPAGFRIAGAKPAIDVASMRMAIPVKNQEPKARLPDGAIGWVRTVALSADVVLTVKVVSPLSKSASRRSEEAIADMH